MHVDSFIPIPPRENDKPFLMPVEDVFSITGRGTVATGRIETGVVNTGDELEIIGLGATKRKSVVPVLKCSVRSSTGVKQVTMSVCFSEVLTRKRLRRGMVLAKPGSITPHTQFKAEVYILKKEEGGRHTPFHNKYRPQFYIRTLMLLVRSLFQKELKWLCPVITLQLQLTLSIRLLWMKVSVLLSVKVAEQLVPDR